MGVPGSWQDLDGVIDHYQGTGRHAELVSLLNGKVVGVDLAIWVGQARNQPNLRGIGFSEEAACSKMAFEKVTSFFWQPASCWPG